MVKDKLLPAYVQILHNKWCWNTEEEDRRRYTFDIFFTELVAEVKYRMRTGYTDCWNAFASRFGLSERDYEILYLNELLFKSKESIC